MASHQPCWLRRQSAFSLPPLTARHDIPCMFTESRLHQAVSIASRTVREREFNLSIHPALAYDDTSMLESSAKVRMAAEQRQTAFWFRCHMNDCIAPSASWNSDLNCRRMSDKGTFQERQRNTNMPHTTHAALIPPQAQCTELSTAGFDISFRNAAAALSRAVMLRGPAVVQSTGGIETQRPAPGRRLAGRDGGLSP